MAAASPAPGAAAVAVVARASSAPVPVTPVPDQLSSVILPAVRGGDGAYQVNIKLQPEELGVVHVELHLAAGTVNVSLHAEGDATRDMLRQNLGQLRQQLADGGLTTGQFDVGSGPGANPEETAPTASDGPADDQAETPPAPATQGQSGNLLSTSQLDVRL
jgi:flagellar hook-length control protein FliK